MNNTDKSTLTGRLRLTGSLLSCFAISVMRIECSSEFEDDGDDKFASVEDDE